MQFSLSPLGGDNGPLHRPEGAGERERERESLFKLELAETQIEWGMVESVCVCVNVTKCV